MNINFCIENKDYTLNELLDCFNSEDVGDCLQTCDKLEANSILYKKNNNYYCFSYVGILLINNVVIFVLPKYIKESDYKKTAKKILLLFQEYSKRENLDVEEIESLGCVFSSNKQNLLSTMIYIINDYLENGLYSNDMSIHVLNGEGTIDWAKTIDEIQPYLHKGNPVYLNYLTTAVESDEDYYFRQLHKFVITECTNIICELGLDEYFGYEIINFSINENSLGSKQYILNNIEIELRLQFVSRKQLLLKAIYNFFSLKHHETDQSDLVFYGSRCFDKVWERVCSYILDNKYESLKNHIARPAWVDKENRVFFKKTMVPDIISVRESNEKTFLISDAKYYLIGFDNNNLYGNPGIEDVTKQYLYQLAFSDYINKNGYDRVINSFVFPSESGEIDHIGSVSVTFLKELNLEDIQLIKMPANQVFDMYINSRKMDLCNYIDNLINYV